MRSLLLGVFLFSACTLRAQVAVFHEDFEAPGHDDSTYSFSLPGFQHQWTLNDRLHHGPGTYYSDSCQVKAGSAVYLLTGTFSTLGKSFVLLSFSHICKVDPADLATIEVTTNLGASWTRLSQGMYLGSGQYGIFGKRFHCGSYGNWWYPNEPGKVPVNAWWKQEYFDISSVAANCADVIIRFTLEDQGPAGPAGQAGWYLDDIRVTGAVSEILPPTVVMETEPQGVMFYPGPYEVRARIIDQSGIDTAFLVLTLNGGPPDTLGMTILLQDTVSGFLPAGLPGDEVCWHLEARDASLNHNSTRYPPAGCIPMTIYNTLTLPFYDHFDTLSNLFTALPIPIGTFTQWELGTPNYGLTSSAHSPPNAWDVNLNTGYGIEVTCSLLTPVFDFSNAVNPRLGFWLNYETEYYRDGVHVDYSTDHGQSWQNLGIIGDPLGKNWYNSILVNSDFGWSGNSQGWKRSSYLLSQFSQLPDPVRFRFSFHSDYQHFLSGFSLDDFSITLPEPQEVALEQVILPVTGCGLGLEQVKICIRNTGSDTVSGNLTAAFRKSGETPVTETFPVLIVPGDTLHHLFSDPVNLSVTGSDSTFALICWVSLPSDPVQDDDTLVQTVVSNALPPAPVVTDVWIPHGTSATLTAVSPYPVKWYNAFTGGTLLGTHHTYLTPLLYDTTVYYAETFGPNACVSPRAPATVFTGQPPPWDAAVTALVSPVTGPNLEDSVTVTALLRNFGTEPATGFPVTYRISNLPAVTDTVAGLIPPGGQMNFSFSTTADLSAFGGYPFKIWCDLPGDTNPLNDTVKTLVTNKLHPYCHSAAISGGRPDIGKISLSNLTYGFNYPVFNNLTAINTYTDLSSLPPALLKRSQDYAITICPIWQLSHTECHVKVFIDWNYDGYFDIFTETAFTGGPTTSSLPNLQGLISVPHDAHLGLTRMRVVLVETLDPLEIQPCGSYLFGETEDYTVNIGPQLGRDLAVVQVSSPPAYCPAGVAVNPVVVIMNKGLDPVMSADLGYRADTGQPVYLSWTGVLPPNTLLPLTFPPAQFIAGKHVIRAWVKMPGDSNLLNDTLDRWFTALRVDTLPYADSFDSLDHFTMEGDGPGNWKLGSPLQGYFPGTVLSPPNVWAVCLNEPFYPNDTRCQLVSQLFRADSIFSAVLSFGIRYQTAFPGDGAWLEYSEDLGLTWHLLGDVDDPHGSHWYNDTLVGALPAWTGNSGNWEQASIRYFNLNQASFLRLRWVFTSDSIHTGKGVAIDDLEILVPPPYDAGVDSILVPNGEAQAFSSVAPVVSITNYGQLPLNAVTVKYQAANGPVVSATWTGWLIPGDDTSFQFTTPYSVPEGMHLLKAWTVHPADGEPLNDTALAMIYGSTTVVAPWYDHFDTGTSYWYATGDLWEHGTPSSAIIDSACSPPYCWKTNLDGPYFKSPAPNYLYSPWIDLTQHPFDSLRFNHWINTHQVDGGRVEYLSTTGWTTLGHMGDPNATNWYTHNLYYFNNNSGYPGWHRSAYDLTTIADFASPTRFRFRFVVVLPNDTFDGWAIDDFAIASPQLPQDAGVVSIDFPSGSIPYGTPMAVKVRLRNFGYLPLTSIPLKYGINGVLVNAGTWTGNLPPDSVSEFVFNPLPTPFQPFWLQAFTNLAGDLFHFNDTSYAFIQVTPPPYDLAVGTFVTPGPYVYYADSVIVTARIRNYGQNPVDSIPLIYRVAENYTGAAEMFVPATPLQPGDSADYAFQQKYKYPFLGYYGLCAATALQDDGFRFNDTLCMTVENGPGPSVPEQEGPGFSLSQNIPNPASGETMIPFTLRHAAYVVFTLTDLPGRVVLNRSASLGPGMHRLVIDAEDLPPGLYFYSLTAGGSTVTRMMLVIR